MGVDIKFSVLLSITSALFLFLNFVQAQNPVPFEAQWSSASFGPDGPWQAVEVTLGDDSKVALYPGHIFQSWIINTEYCKLNNSNGCYASKAGTYNNALALQDGSGSTSGIVYEPPISDWMVGMEFAGKSPKFWVEAMQLKSGASNGPTHEVANVSLSILEDQMLAYPGGKWYPAFAGCLGIGAPNTINQSFSTDTYPVNASLVPGMLWAQQKTPSNSFSMHIGSVFSRMGGSLLYGGYDRNRLVGDVLVADNDFIDDPITLKDISIDVVQGASPFNFTTQDGLLTSGNRSMGNGLRVSVDGCAPYITLPKSTCDNIALHLPVTYDTNLGLYLWDVDSPKYSQIVSSASALSFTFLSDANTKPLTIRVPFIHLNLTLTEPLVESPAQYFPCFTGGAGRYALGRAFLQDAFLGANWGKSKWWLGQAPGPNIQLSSSISPISADDTVITPGNNNWEESWKGAWKVLTDDEANGAAPVEPPVQTGPASDVNQETSAPEGLSTGAIAGIAVGGVVVLALIGLESHHDTMTAVYIMILNSRHQRDLWRHMALRWYRTGSIMDILCYTMPSNPGLVLIHQISSSSYSASLASSAVDYPVEHGRRYHAFRPGAYFMPNDEHEMDRLDLSHATVLKLLGERLYLAPLEKDHVQNILDIGTGTGIWAMEMGDFFPEAQIYGNDLSPIQPDWVPPNVKFEVDDVESPWLDDRKYDYIFCRFMFGSIKDWPNLVKNIYDNLNPGGWAEFIDINSEYYSTDGTLTEDHAARKWNKTLLDAIGTMGREISPGPKLESWVRDAGFEKIFHKKHVVPVGPWPKDPHYKQLGLMNVMQALKGLEGFTMRVFCGVLGRTPAEVMVELAAVRKELKTLHAFHAQYDVHVVYGQKRLQGEST
ncbi:aspartic-type endopeptidase [Colletotrichum karsti]|uniref:Aspartic-type endopeptidase n=1 Tax=Colletotrichum karsti TaxID=1095194 RepID=A0A9P6I520_9PEZI|nr:aspartic-type endopeptidase [Colletotrichum karsti]KAF9874131.1 aspartic-type endopeptidase [Colletotrichum karsti]